MRTHVCPECRSAFSVPDATRRGFVPDHSDPLGPPGSLCAGSPSWSAPRR